MSNILYRCCICGADTTQKHEPIFGSKFKKLCEFYNITLPICILCHSIPHGRPYKEINPNNFLLITYNSEKNPKLRKRAVAKVLLTILELDYHKTFNALNSNKREYLEQNREHCREVIESYIKESI